MASFAENLDSMSRLTQILDTDNDVLKNPFREYASLWEWTLQQERGEEVASHILENRGWLVPINAVNNVTGDSVVTNSTNRVLRPGIFKKLLYYGEKLDYINQKTGDSFLHALSKQFSAYGSLLLLKEVIDEIENSNFEWVNFPNPDHKNIDGKTALNICLQNNKIELARLLVDKLGANWAIRPKGDFSLDENAIDLLNYWRLKYGFYSNNFFSEIGDVCILCCEALNVPEEIYSMECCGTLIHVECFRTYLCRSSKPQCTFCNILVVEEMRRRVPQTIYKNHWQPYITHEAIETAAAAMARTMQKKFDDDLAKMKQEEERRFDSTRHGSRRRRQGTNTKTGRRRQGTTTRTGRRRTATSFSDVLGK